MSAAAAPLTPGTKAAPCRLCGGNAHKMFETTVLGRYEVSFFRCQKCDSLQSERPYWLDEAYGSAIAAADTGAVARNLISHAAIVCIAHILNVRGRLLDFGGGAGMLCRLLRDSGFDAYMSDRYSDSAYAKAFVVDLADVSIHELGLLSAIEVFEHCAEPATDLGEIFGKRPRVLVATTNPYRGEDAGWWYLGTQAGQHVFFYSPKALELLGKRHGYHYLGIDSFQIFSETRISPLRTALLKLALSRVGIRIARIWLAATLRGRHADRDYSMLCRELGRGDPKGGRSGDSS